MGVVLADVSLRCQLLFVNKRGATAGKVCRGLHGCALEVGDGDGM